jgi:BON domain
VITPQALGHHVGQGNKIRTAGVLVSSIAICAVALLSGCSSSRTIDDVAITKSVKANLAAVFGPIEATQVRQLDRGADRQIVSYISVNSVNGFVTLTGEVRSKRAKERAGEIARSVDQVVTVNNNLTVAPGYSDDAVNDKP